MNDTTATGTFTIDQGSLAQRRRNILLGLVFSLVLALVVVFGHYRYPATYNAVLLWSVLGFVIIGNLVNWLRHRRYVRLVRNHRIEVHQGRVEFWTGGEKSVLEVGDIAALTLYRRRGSLRHVQVRLTNNRGIRLEGYRDLERLAALLADQIPKAHLVERSI